MSAINTRRNFFSKKGLASQDPFLFFIYFLNMYFIKTKLTNLLCAAD